MKTYAFLAATLAALLFREPPAHAARLNINVIEAMHANYVSDCSLKKLPIAVCQAFYAEASNGHLYQVSAATDRLVDQYITERQQFDASHKLNTDLRVQADVLTAEKLTWRHAAENVNPQVYLPRELLGLILLACAVIIVVGTIHSLRLLGFIPKHREHSQERVAEPWATESVSGRRAIEFDDQTQVISGRPRARRILDNLDQPPGPDPLLVSDTRTYHSQS